MIASYVSNDTGEDMEIKDVPAIGEIVVFIIKR
jgi:hypothetical protein